MVDSGQEDLIGAEEGEEGVGESGGRRQRGISDQNGGSHVGGPSISCGV
jgi:hypothetical protein